MKEKQEAQVAQQKLTLKVNFEESKRTSLGIYTGAKNILCFGNGFLNANETKQRQWFIIVPWEIDEGKALFLSSRTNMLDRS